ncbi:MAG: hypothetical protein ACYC4K_02840 [Thiobacillus sp.]
MSNNFSKLWAQKRINQASIQRAQEAIHATGRALPCVVTAVSGSIVTVAFQVAQSNYTLPRITIPKAESNWIRNPTQVGDTGITVPADVYIGIISGLGSGLPNINVRPANLSALVFMPVSNKASPPQDQNAAQIQGPNGAIIQTTTGTASSVVTNQNGTTVTFGGASIVVNASGISMSFSGKTVALTSSGLTIDGILFDTHAHQYTPGTGAATNTGGPVS